jgi:hypothetical protein
MTFQPPPRIMNLRGSAVSTISNGQGSRQYLPASGAVPSLGTQRSEWIFWSTIGVFSASAIRTIINRLPLGSRVIPGLNAPRQ